MTFDSPIFVTPASHASHVESPVTSLLRLGECRPQQNVEEALAQLQWNHAELQSNFETGHGPSLMPSITTLVTWAEQQHSDGHLQSFDIGELVTLAVCSSRHHMLLNLLNQVLKDGSIRIVDGDSPWATIFAFLVSGLAKLPSPVVSTGRLFYSAWIPRSVWNDRYHGREGDVVRFNGVLRVSTCEQMDMLEADQKNDCVACVFVLHGFIASDAVEIRRSFACSEVNEAILLLPRTPGVLKRIENEEVSGMQILWVHIQALPAVEPLASIVQAPAERALAGALLVGLHNSTPTHSSPLLRGVIDCFEALASAVKVKSPEAVAAVWKGYFECLLEGISMHSWKDVNETIKSGVTNVARVAVTDLSRAAQGVTKRALGYESCLNHTAMKQENARRLQNVENLKASAVAVARQQVHELQLETLTDPDAFIQFIQHDPVKAFEAAPAAIKAYIDAGPAQRVLLLAKLMGLVAMAGRLLRGDPQVLSAFESSFPLNGGTWGALSRLLDPQATEEIPLSKVANDELQQAETALATLQLLQLHLARTRLVIVAGAPDVGKTTFLREVFGLDQLVAGLSQAGRTEQLTFELHPEGDEERCPIFLVDTPGYGDGESLYRNDMGRLLLGAGSWLPGGVILLWVTKAGRSIRQEADEFLRNMAAANFEPVVVVTHIDKLFEERYREVGPRWREGLLKDVPPKDKRWKEARSLLMKEIHEEIVDGIRSVLGDFKAPEIVYTCLSGWMAQSGDDAEDEFAQQPPWQWAREELTLSFGIRNRTQLRKWLDDKVGFL